MEAIKYQKHSNRLFAKPLFNIRDDSKEKGRVYRNNPNPKIVFFQKMTDNDSGRDPDPAFYGHASFLVLLCIAAPHKEQNK